MRCCISCFFFFNDTATTEIYTLSLHDALPIFGADEHPFTRIVDNHFIEEAFTRSAQRARMFPALDLERMVVEIEADRKSTRLNSSHQIISYAVFCLKKKKTYSKSIIKRTLQHP